MRENERASERDGCLDRVTFQADRVQEGSREIARLEFFEVPREHVFLLRSEA